LLDFNRAENFSAALSLIHSGNIQPVLNVEEALDAAYAASLAQIPDSLGKTRGIAVGEEVAAKVLAWRAADGADAANTYRPITTPGTYIVTTLPIGTQWGSVTPWVMERGSQFHPAPPPAPDSAAWAADYNEVKEIGGKKSVRRTSGQTEIALFWVMAGPKPSIL
jgi:hypothetical protein